MTNLIEFAPAKVNLTLRVRGRRDDGYHELESLVAFAADVADTLTAFPGEVGFEVVGPFATAISGTNLVDLAVAALRSKVSENLRVRLLLDKKLPIASGIGGGSADAAAALRLLSRLETPRIDRSELCSLARTLGADVPVCLGSSAAIMRGIGDRIVPLRLPAGLSVVLVNPLAAVPHDKTARVFAALAANKLSGLADEGSAPEFAVAGDVMRYLAGAGNDLEAAAIRVVPAVGDVLKDLRDMRVCEIVRLSGAGPTCFALFETLDTAASAADEIAKRHPSWWIRVSVLV